VVGAERNRRRFGREVPSFGLPVPSWLPALAEVLGGKRLSLEGIPGRIALGEFRSLEREMKQLEETDQWSRWGRSFFSGRATRTISPFSTIAVQEYVRQRIEGDTSESLSEAVRLSPTNGLIFARLARRVLEQQENPCRVGEADFLSRRAVALSPQDLDVRRIRGEIKARTSN